jgi:hypothetical protein
MTDEGPPANERRTTERRRYQRRRTEDITPPYYEAFERMAVALEGIREQLAGRSQIALPSDSTGPPAPRSPARRR